VLAGPSTVRVNSTPAEMGRALARGAPIARSWPSGECMVYSRDEPPKTVAEPDYQVLRDWFEAWPEARPELLDFWARGGYVQRLMWRRQQTPLAVSVGVRYLDVAETVIRRLALLDAEVDIVWGGDVSRRSLVIAPQDVDYEGVGGWGYMTCSGDQLEDRRGREWCPSLAWAVLMPDTITDWLATEAASFFYAGRLFMCPAAAVGIPKRDPGRPVEHPGFTHAAQIRTLRKQLNLLFTVDLPALERMDLPDVYKFCRDHTEELGRYREAVAELFSQREGDAHADSIRKMQAEIRDAVSELISSDKAKGMRRILIAAGGALGTAQLAVALNSGVDYTSFALTASGAAVAAAKWWDDRLRTERERRRNPYWVLWKLQGGRSGALQFRSPRLGSGMCLPGLPNPEPDAPMHWLAPPSGGWTTPTATLP